jgi:hypothetical protein
MATGIVLDQIRRNFERAAICAEDNFLDFEVTKERCGDPLCRYCRRLLPQRKVHHENVRLIRKILDEINPRRKPSVSLVLDSRPGYGMWNGYITDDGFFINGRFGVGADSGDIGHESLREEYASYCGEKRANALLKLHAQAKTEIMLFRGSPVLTRQQLLTLEEIFVVTPEELWFIFKYDLQHPMKDIPF